jgi:hypothetical protein
MGSGFKKEEHLIDEPLLLRSFLSTQSSFPGEHSLEAYEAEHHAVGNYESCSRIT